MSIHSIEFIMSFLALLWLLRNVHLISLDAYWNLRQSMLRILEWAYNRKEETANARRKNREELASLDRQIAEERRKQHEEFDKQTKILEDTVERTESQLEVILEINKLKLIMRQRTRPKGSAPSKEEFEDIKCGVEAEISIRLTLAELKQIIKERKEASAKRTRA